MIKVETTTTYKTEDGKLFEDKVLATNWAIRLEFVAIMKGFLEESGLAETMEVHGVEWERDLEKYGEAAKWDKITTFLHNMASLISAHKNV